MGHLSHHKAYLDLQARLDRMPAGFPASPEGQEVLRLLFRPEEAELAALLPFRPQTARRIARRARRPEAEVRKLLEQMADRGLVFDLEHRRRGVMLYCAAPPVVGFVEFSLMRKRSDLDQPALAARFQAFFDGDAEHFGKTLFGGETQIGRTLVHESALPPDHAELLPYERAAAVVGAAGSVAVSLCYCRHLAEHLQRSCAAPKENCLSLGAGADYVIRHGHGRAISRHQALEILDQSRQAGLVFIADNVQRRLTYLCSCCGCCCEMLRSITRHGLPGAVKTSSWAARIDLDACQGCGRCVRRCPVQGISLQARPPAPVPRKPALQARVDETVCLGCGLCQPVCRSGALQMVPRAARVLTPETTFHRMLAMALERDRLQDLLFDEKGSVSELVLNRLAGAVLQLPPVKRLLLSQRLKSRFVGALVAGPRQLLRQTRV